VKSLERRIHEAVSMLRRTYPNISFSSQSLRAIGDEDKDGDGRLDELPDTDGTGSEAGELVVSGKRANGESFVVLKENELDPEASVQEILNAADEVIVRSRT
jgi:hypothetical protein